MKRWIWLIALLSVLTIACSPAPVDSPTVTPTAPVDFAAPIETITVYLSEQTQIPLGDLKVDRVEAINWPDSCLGLAQANEMCLQVITPGFRVELTAPEQRFVVHSDRTGRLIRLKP